MKVHSEISVLRISVTGKGWPNTPHTYGLANGGLAHTGPIAIGGFHDTETWEGTNLKAPCAYGKASPVEAEDTTGVTDVTGCPLVGALERS